MNKLYAMVAITVVPWALAVIVGIADGPGWLLVTLVVSAVITQLTLIGMIAADVRADGG